MAFPELSTGAIAGQINDGMTDVGAATPSISVV